MFKKCKKSVCSTNSIRPNPKAVTVLHHRKSESAAENHFSNEGTNLWLRNGGVLPLVSVDPAPNEVSTQRVPTKHLARTVKSHTVTKQTTPAQVGHLLKKSTCSDVDSQSKASPKSVKTADTFQKNCEEKQVDKKDNHFVVNKKNYINIISHFNEQDYKDVYKPAEYCELANKHSSPCTKRIPDTTTIPEVVHYSDKNKAKILLSIREELKSWSSEGLNN